MRRATRQRANIKCKISYFYPRSPCGERQRRGLQNLHLRYFYPRSPCGERHILPITSNVVIRISIHALLAESDDTSKDTIKTVVNFYPRSPCGERHTNTYYAILSVQFLSTLSLRRATTDMRQRLIEFRFLSTLSLRRATKLRSILVLILLEFLSTLSLRRATDCVRYCIRAPEISIHALLAESDIHHRTRR